MKLCTPALGAALLVFLLVTGLLDGGLYHLQYLFFAAIAFALLAAMLLHGMMRDYRVEWTALPQARQHVASPPGPP